MATEQRETVFCENQFLSLIKHMRAQHLLGFLTKTIKFRTWEHNRHFLPAYLSTQVPGLLGHFIYCRIERITSFFTSSLERKERDTLFSDSQGNLIIANSHLC